MIPPSHVTDSMIDRAEEICGMGHNAWDCIPQQEVFAACVSAWLEEQTKAEP